MTDLIEDLGNGWQRIDNGPLKPPTFREIATGNVISERRFNLMMENGKVPKVGGYAETKEPHFNEEEPYSVPSFPEPKSKATRASAGKATSKELALAFETNLLILTSVVALFTGLPEVGMSEAEAKSISIPAANIFESSDLNKQIGKTIANSGDYSLLGYALYLYLFRVVTTHRSRQGVRPEPSNNQTSNQGPGTGNGTGTSGTQGVPLPYRPGGLRGFTTPTG